MTSPNITLQLPDTLYRSAQRMAQATERPLSEIIADSLAHALPPLDDVPEEEVVSLVKLSLLDDAQLWQVAAQSMPPEDQDNLYRLLDEQSAGQLNAHGREQLTNLLEKYNQLMLHKAHAWLLLARRGYHVPPQQSR